MRLQPPKGTRDLLGEKAQKLERMIRTIKEVFEKYGFQPIFTPAFESFELLSSKGGLGEAVKDEIYYFKDKSERELGLRFDLTMSLARIAAATQLQKPFKRYAIDRVWRYDNPQALRFREFWQADIDILGTSSILADAECLAAACECLEKIGFENYYVRINNRKLIQDLIIRNLGTNNVNGIIRILDKWDKINKNIIIRDIAELVKDRDENLLKFIDFLEFKEKKYNNKEIIEKLKNNFKDLNGLDEIENLLNVMKYFGFDEKIKIDISLARGLDYYTGLIFEIMITGIENISVGGGGRYDNLIKNISDKDIPATGISLGLDRLLELLPDKAEQKTKVFVAAATDDVRAKAIAICQELRKNGIASEIDLSDRNLGKQLEYAASQQARFVLIVGKEELKKNSVKIRDMRSGKEKLIKTKDLAKFLGKAE